MKRAITTPLFALAASVEKSAGFSYRPDFITADEERTLIREIERLTFHEVRMHGVVARARGEIFVQPLEPRSMYILDGAARWQWQHSVPPTKSLDTRSA